MGNAPEIGTGLKFLSIRKLERHANQVTPNPVQKRIDAGVLRIGLTQIGRVLP